MGFPDSPWLFSVWGDQGQSHSHFDPKSSGVGITDLLSCRQIFPFSILLEFSVLWGLFVRSPRLLSTWYWIWILISFFGAILNSVGSHTLKTPVHNFIVGRTHPEQERFLRLPFEIDKWLRPEETLVKAMVLSGVYENYGQAIRDGWNRPIPPGFSQFYGTPEKPVLINIFNPSFGKKWQDTRALPEAYPGRTITDWITDPNTSADDLEKYSNLSVNLRNLRFRYRIQRSLKPLGFTIYQIKRATPALSLVAAILTFTVASPAISLPVGVVLILLSAGARAL